MYVLKSFLKIDNFSSAEAHLASPVGKLSDISLTYSKDKGFYSYEGYTNFELIAFKSTSDDHGIAQTTPVPDRVGNFIMRFAKWSRDYASNLPQYFNSSTGTLAFKTALEDAIESNRDYFPFDIGNPLDGTITTYADVEIGVSEGYSTINRDGDKYFINSVTISMDYMVEVSGSVVRRNAQITLWLSDNAFRTEYDEFEIVVVPMVDDIDEFFDTYSNVLVLAEAARNQINAVTRFNVARGIHPETVSKIVSYNWHDDNLPPNTIPVPWGILIYGPAGDNLDAVREALRNYILENTSSAHNEDDWGDIFPGIFRVSEFTYIPMWHRYSVNNILLPQGLYSPVVNLYRDKGILSTFLTQATEEYILEHAESFNFQYKSLALYVVPSIHNRVDLLKLQSAVPNFAAIPISSLDLNRLNEDAVSYLKLMTNAIISAEEMSGISPLKPGINRLIRGGRMYAAFELNEKTHVVLSKPSLTDIFPPILASEE